jgi:hypothetical protein
MEELFMAYGHSSDDEICSPRENRKTPPQSESSHSQMKRRKIDVPLPSIFDENKKDLMSEKERQEKHQGRVRQFPHVEGNYATFFYVPVADISLTSCSSHSSQTFRSYSQEVLEMIQKELSTATDSSDNRGHCPQLHLQEEHHISLSKVFPIRRHHVELLVEHIQNAIAASLMPKFTVELKELQYYTNEDRTRSFVSLNVSEGKRELISLIGYIDSVLEAFGFPTYYENPSPHVSIAWCLGDIRSHVPRLSKLLPKSLHFAFEVNFVCCKIGKWMYKFNLT